MKPCSLAFATMILECFPISKVVASESKNGRGKKFKLSSSEGILMPITQWPKNNRDRLAVMCMLLEQGCNPNDKISNTPCGTQNMPAFYYRLSDTPLHQAAERGDDQMVKLLLEFGAKRDIKSGEPPARGGTPAQRARARQHFGLLPRLRAGD